MNQIPHSPKDHAEWITVLYNSKIYSKINKKVVVHILIHAFATRVAKKGENNKAIKEQQGHSDINATVRFLHLSQNKIHKTQSQLDLL